MNDGRLFICEKSRIDNKRENIETFFGGIVIKIERSTETFKRGGVYDMEQAALKKMRTKQIAVSNLFVGLMIIVFLC